MNCKRASNADGNFTIVLCLFVPLSHIDARAPYRTRKWLERIGAKLSGSIVLISTMEKHS